MIHRPTRITPTSATLLDHIHTNQTTYSNISGNLFCDATDHLPVFNISFVPTIKASTNSDPLPFRMINLHNMNLFKVRLQEMDWNNVTSIDDPNTAYNNFESSLKTIYNQCFPLQYKTKKNVKIQPWITQGILNSVKLKHKLYSRFLKNPSAINEKIYKQYRNILTNVIRQTKSDYFKNKFQQNKSDIKKTWDTINSLLKKSKTRNSSTSINCNGRLSKDPVEIANCFNDFFVEIGPTLASKINNNPNSTFNDYLPAPVVNSMFLNPVDEYELTRIILSFNNNKAPGIDEFNTKAIKHVFNFISKPLCHIFNISISHGIFPDKLKHAKVTPVFKAGPKSEINNYRPISILSIFSKIFERIIYDRMYTFIQNNNILYEHQFGFRKGHSTSMALIDLTNEIIDAFQNNSYAMGILIDLSKAFDTIDHDILLAKLYNYGLRGIVFNLLKSYLCNRSQCTKYMNATSEFRYISCGVPQGSLLGPLLFILYINDLYNSSKRLSFFLYADDTTILYSNDDIYSLFEVVNSELNSVIDYFSVNKLSVNINKCNAIVFHGRNKSFDPSNKTVKLNNVVIPLVSTVKFLGIYIDSQLNWKPHIECISNKISKNIGIIYRLSKFIPQSILRILYCSLILPYLNYCNVVWANNYPDTLDKLIKLQKKAVRIISLSLPYSHTDPIFSLLKLLKISDINTLQQCSFMHDLVYKRSPLFNNLIQFNLDFHNYDTRSANLLHLPLPRTNALKFNIRYSGPKVWNNISLELRNIVNKNSFTHKLKLNLISKY